MSNNSATESELTLPLYRMLEDEYMNLYGPLPEGYPWPFFQEHIKDPVALIEHFHLIQNKSANHLRAELFRLIKERPQVARPLLEVSDLSDPDQAKKEQEELRQS